MVKQRWYKTLKGCADLCKYPLQEFIFQNYGISPVWCVYSTGYLFSFRVSAIEHELSYIPII